MKVYTIGFTKRKAAEFFGALRRAGIKRLVDVRLNNVSQLAGFTKRDDLEFFLRELCCAEYVHMPSLAPSEEILEKYRKKQINWQDYEKHFISLMNERKIAETLDRKIFEIPTVFLCSEPTPERCHRRLVAEFLSDKWGDLAITHL